MQKSTKTILIIVAVILFCVIAGYFGYRLYEAAVQDATQRIRAGVAKGIGDGIGEGIGKGIRRSFF